MNTASRMESTSLPGRVQVSDTTLQLLGDKAERWEPTGGVQVKGSLATPMAHLTPGPPLNHTRLPP
ncbi:guanylate cyclase domain-containing protein, partial [Haematococcus lacustris]